MPSNRRPKLTRPIRRLDRIAGLTVILALSLATMPATGLAGGTSSVGLDRGPFAILDLAQLDQALGRGALPVELLMAASLAAIAVGFVLTVFVGTLRRRRLVKEAAPVPAEPSDDKMDAARAEAWAAREASIEIARDTAGWPSDTRPREESEPRAASFDRGPLAERAQWRETSDTRASTGIVDDSAVTRPTLDALESPLPVNLHDGPEAGASHPASSNLPLVAMIGTVAVGVAFSGGAVIGATLGVGVGAAIGLAFAVGAGTAIGATVALLGHRG